MKAHYSQKFYQNLFDFILKRKRMDMKVWLGTFKQITDRWFRGEHYAVRDKSAECNTIACLSGHAAFIDPVVAGTTNYGTIIGNKVFSWHSYSRRVFGPEYEILIMRCNWYEFMDLPLRFYRLPKYKQAAMALYFFVETRFDYILDVPDDLKKIANPS